MYKGVERVLRPVSRLPHLRGFAILGWSGLIRLCPKNPFGLVGMQFCHVGFIDNLQIV